MTSAGVASFNFNSYEPSQARAAAKPAKRGASCGLCQRSFVRLLCASSPYYPRFTSRASAPPPPARPSCIRPIPTETYTVWCYKYSLCSVASAPGLAYMLPLFCHINNRCGYASRRWVLRVPALVPSGAVTHEYSKGGSSYTPSPSSIPLIILVFVKPTYHPT